MTLIEVLAGLALLATLLASMLVAKGKWTRQQTVAQRRIAAVRAADALLSDWWKDPAKLAKPEEGRLDELNLCWRRSIVPNDTAKELGGRVVRVEISDLGQSSDTAVLAAVEVMVSDDESGTKH